MLRSQINRILQEAEGFLDDQKFKLPPFAYWTPEDWEEKRGQVRTIVERRLGWDITDFGTGSYREQGLFLFTLRNGDPQLLRTGRGQLYAEKVLIVEPDQLTPLHFHKVKTEDIINRGGGKLAIQLYNSTEVGDLEESDVMVSVDGVERVVAAGATIELEPGESITLTEGLYHAFWGVDRRVLVGEVSLVNDDASDNYFYDPVGRFPQIEEDEAPRYLLVGDYDRYLGGE